jgi:hypothetical protein
MRSSQFEAKRLDAANYRAFDLPRFETMPVKHVETVRHHGLTVARFGWFFDEIELAVYGPHHPVADE